MNCSPSALKDYLLGEMPAAERRSLEQHVERCDACREEKERLQLAHSALMTLREEEPPRRIAFVSDQVFEPSWWQRFWRSGPQLGFASAAMLAVAILVHGATQPVPVVQQVLAPTTAAVDTTQLEQRIAAEVDRRVQAAVAQVVSEVKARQEKQWVATMAAAKREMEMERQANQVAFGESMEQLAKLRMATIRASLNWPVERAQ